MNHEAFWWIQPSPPLFFLNVKLKPKSRAGSSPPSCFNNKAKPHSCDLQSCRLGRRRRKRHPRRSVSTCSRARVRSRTTWIRPSAEWTPPPSVTTGTTGSWPSAASSAGSPASAARRSYIQSRCFTTGFHGRSSQTLPLIRPLRHIRWLSCILWLAQQAEEATDPQRAAAFSQRAKKFGIIAIVLWVVLLASIPILMALISYLLTLLD